MVTANAADIESEARTLCKAIPDWLRGQKNDAAASPTFPLVCLVHGVGPLLHKVNSEQLSVTSPSPTIPNLSISQSLSLQSPVSPSLRLPWLAQQYEFNRQRMARFHEELHDILTLFARHEIEVMPLKGAVLSVVYYDDPALRPMSDLDLLVRPHRLERAAALLSQLGYQPESRNWKHIELSKPDNRQVVSYDSEHPDNPRRLDLHAYCHEMFAGPKVDLTAGMWANATPGTLLGQPAWLPHPDWLWLHLLLHTSGNIWGNRLRLINLVDLVQVQKSTRNSVNSEQLAVNREQLFSTQHSALSTQPFTNVEARFVYLGAMMLQKVFPEAFSTEGLTELGQKTPRRLREWAAEMDLFTASYLGRRVARPYWWKLTRFYQARPRDLHQIARFLLLPSDGTPLLQHMGRSVWLASRLLHRGTVDNPNAPKHS